MGSCLEAAGGATAAAAVAAAWCLADITGPKAQHACVHHFRRCQMEIVLHASTPEPDWIVHNFLAQNQSLNRVSEFNKIGRFADLETLKLLKSSVRLLG